MTSYNFTSLKIENCSSGCSLFAQSQYWKMSSGKVKLTEVEEEKLLCFDDAHHGEPALQDWKKLVQEMDKTMKTLQTCLKRLKKKNDVFLVLKNSRYSLVEDKQILEFIDGLNVDWNNPDALKALRSSDFAPLAQVFQRSEGKTYDHFHGFLLPIILPTIYESLSRATTNFAKHYPRQWENNFINYIIDDIVDWQCVLGKGGLLPKSQISSFILKSRMGCSGQAAFLYQEIAAHRNKIPLAISISLPKWIEERKVKIINIYKSIKDAKDTKQK